MRDWKTIVKDALLWLKTRTGKRWLRNREKPVQAGLSGAFYDAVLLWTEKVRKASDDAIKQLIYVDSTGVEHPLSYIDAVGAQHPITLVATMYEDTKCLCLRLVQHVNGVPELLDPITVNVKEMPPYMAYVKDEPENQWMLSIIEKSHIGAKMWSKNQYEPHGMVQFHEEILRRYHCAGLEEYHNVVTANYCGKIDFLYSDGFPADTKYFKTLGELQKVRKDCIYYGEPIITLRYNMKRVVNYTLRNDMKRVVNHPLRYDMKRVVDRMESAVLNRKTYRVSNDANQEKASHHSDR